MEVKMAVEDHLSNYDGQPQSAFTSSVLRKSPILIRNKVITEVTIWEERYTKKVRLNDNITPAQISKIVDPRIKELLEMRIIEHGGSIKEAFKSLQEEPVYSDEKNKMAIRAVKVFDEGRLRPVRSMFIGDHEFPNDYVYTKGNHHALIHLDQNGKYHATLVSLLDAVQIGLTNYRQTGKIYSVIDRSNKENSHLSVFNANQ